RDTVRRYWRGDAGMRPEMAGRISGSADLFGVDGARKPWASINYVASHDGMTLHDLVSYSQKHNEANGEQNADGHSENFSGNWGVEGPTEDEGIVAIRERLKRAMLVTLFTSVGTPMLLAGDEFGRTQQGNNNAYCQDDEMSLVDLNRGRSPLNATLMAFTTRLAAIRHAYGIFRVRHFLHGNAEIAPGVLDIDWLDERGQRLSPEDWSN